MPCLRCLELFLHSHLNASQHLGNIFFTQGLNITRMYYVRTHKYRYKQRYLYNKDTDINVLEEKSVVILIPFLNIFQSLNL